MELFGAVLSNQFNVFVVTQEPNVAAADAIALVRVRSLILIVLKGCLGVGVINTA